MSLSLFAPQEAFSFLSDQLKRSCVSVLTRTLVIQTTFLPTQSNLIGILPHETRSTLNHKGWEHKCRSLVIRVFGLTTLTGGHPPRMPLAQTPQLQAITLLLVEIIVTEELPLIKPRSLVSVLPLLLRLKPNNYNITEVPEHRTLQGLLNLTTNTSFTVCKIITARLSPLTTF